MFHTEVQQSVQEMATSIIFIS